MMQELMDKTWEQYEAEKAAGNAETADTIADVYTALDMLLMGWDAEENRDSMEKAYYGICDLSWKREGFKHGNLFEIRMGLEEKLVAVGILEPDEEPEEADEYDSETNYDEWVADQRYEAYRDYDLAMGYER